MTLTERIERYEAARAHLARQDARRDPAAYEEADDAARLAERLLKVALPSYPGCAEHKGWRYCLDQLDELYRYQWDPNSYSPRRGPRGKQEGVA